MEDALKSRRREGTDRRIRLMERDAFMDHHGGATRKSGRSREMLRRGMNKRHPGSFRNSCRHDSELFLSVYETSYKSRPNAGTSAGAVIVGLLPAFFDVVGQNARLRTRVELYSQALMPTGAYRQNPFFLLLSNVTFRYGNRGGFLGSLTIGFRSSLPSANVIRRKRSSPCCTISILVAVFTMAKELNSPRPVPPA